MIEIFFQVAIIYLVGIGLFMLIRSHGPRLFKYLKNNQLKRFIGESKDDAWDKLMKMQEMNAIKKAGVVSLRNIKIFIADPEMDYKYLKNHVVPEFNNSAPKEEHIDNNLSNEELRKIFLEKAEEYNTTSNPLLEVLVESFTSYTHRDPKRPITKSS